jgi:hypothetical protein
MSATESDAYNHEKLGLIKMDETEHIVRCLNENIPLMYFLFRMA